MIKFAWTCVSLQFKSLVSSVVVIVGIPVTAEPFVATMSSSHRYSVKFSINTAYCDTKTVGPPIKGSLYKNILSAVQKPAQHHKNMIYMQYYRVPKLIWEMLDIPAQNVIEFRSFNRLLVSLLMHKYGANSDSVKDAENTVIKTCWHKKQKPWYNICDKKFKLQRRKQKSWDISWIISKSECPITYTFWVTVWRSYQ